MLYFEDTSVVKKLQEAFPSYKDNFPTWSQHTSAMHQFAIWTMLEDMGLGASLQHYNPLIDDEVRRTWNLPGDWMLIAQMPFGTPTGEPGEKEFEDLSKRIKIFLWYRGVFSLELLPLQEMSYKLVTRSSYSS